MSTTADDGSAPALPPDDQALLVRFGRGQQWLRAVLCTLARRGGHIRETDPARARQILDELSRSPLYRGGQFLFDLLELEDFMVDGDPPPPVPTVLDEVALRQLWLALQRLRSTVDGTATVDETATADGTATAAAEQDTEDDTSVTRERREHLSALDLACAHRPISAHLHLFTDVVIGIVASLNPAPQ